MSSGTMDDPVDTKTTDAVRIVGSASDGTEQTPVKSTGQADLQTADVPNQQGVNTTLNLTTTAQEAKVGVSTLTDRKFVEIYTTVNNVKWGYDTTCPFDLLKNQFASIPAGTNNKVYLKMSTGTGTCVVAEK